MGYSCNSVPFDALLWVKVCKVYVAHQLIRGPESNYLHIAIVIADCVPLPQGIEGCNSTRVKVLIQRPPDRDSRSQRLIAMYGHLRRQER